MHTSKNKSNVSNPFPLIKPQDTLLSRKLLTVHKKVEYWSYIYDEEGLIYKQTTDDLALREANILRMLDSDYFPKVKDAWVKDNYSVVVLEKIIGESLHDFSNKLRDEKVLYELVLDFLRILDELEKKDISHRDIRADNILIRNNHPVLIDFGWAESSKEKIFTPTDLGGKEGSPFGEPSDIYSMGKVMEQIRVQISPTLTHFLSLIICVDPNLRVTNISFLISVWLSLEDNIKNPQNYIDNQMVNINNSVSAQSVIILKLLEQITRHNESTTKVKAFYDFLKWQLILFLKRIIRRIIPIGSRREKFIKSFF